MLAVLLVVTIHLCPPKVLLVVGRTTQWNQFEAKGLNCPDPDNCVSGSCGLERPMPSLCLFCWLFVVIVLFCFAEAAFSASSWLLSVVWAPSFRSRLIFPADSSSLLCGLHDNMGHLLPRGSSVSVHPASADNSWETSSGSLSFRCFVFF